MGLLRAAGVPCEAHEAPGMFHVFPFLLPWARESREVYERVGAFIAGALQTANRPAARRPKRLA